MILLIVEGIEQLSDRVGYKRLAQFALIAVLCFNPLLEAGLRIIRPRLKEEIRPVMAYVAERKQPGDFTYVYYGAQPAFEFYMRDYGFEPENVRKGIMSCDNWHTYVADLNTLAGKQRVWLIFAHAELADGTDEERVFCFYLDQIGNQRDSFEAMGASAYLYDLSSLPVGAVLTPR